LEAVSTTCDSGWVGDQHAILLMIFDPYADPPATAWWYWPLPSMNSES